MSQSWVFVLVLYAIMNTYLPFIANKYIEMKGDNMKQLPQGKGLYVWTIKGQPDHFAEEYKSLGISWIAVKVCDGVNSFNLRSLPGGGWADDILGPFIDICRDAGIKVGGWGYVYGFNPLDEADKARQRIEKYDLDFFLIDAEMEYMGKHSQASQYSQLLRKLVPNVPLALSSYRFPESFPKFPFAEFLQHCDFNAPQVYWNEGKSIRELQTCDDQYAKIKLLPMIPAGRAYFGEGFPMPTPAEIVGFLDTACKDEMKGAFFWSADFLWHRLHKNKMKPIRDAIRDYEWEVYEPEPEPEPPQDEDYFISLVIGSDVYEGTVNKVLRPSV